MLCEHCKKNAATTYLKQTVNGKTTEIFLCDECAQRLGVNGGLQSVGSLLPELFGRGGEIAQLQCPNCGIGYGAVTQSGMVGCAHCYGAFAQRLDPVIRRMHGSRKHAGKVPKSFADKPENRVDALKKQLRQAVEKEDFETAAKLRDQIRAAEGGEA